MIAEPTTRSVLMTPPGSGAIAIIRVVGPKAQEVLAQAFTPFSGRGLPQAVGRLAHGSLTCQGEIIDDVLVCKIAEAPEVVCEVCAHGGMRVVERVLETLSALGAPLDKAATVRAEPTPHSGALHRDFATSLAQVKTMRGLRFLAWQRANLENALRELAGRFADGDEQALGELRMMVRRGEKARLILSGVRIAILGPPNAGKSTLFNRLVGRAAALVSATPGTTRDWIDDEIVLSGIPCRLIDTAGQRDGVDPLEQEAIQRGRDAMQDADIFLIVLDAANPCESALMGYPGLSARSERVLLLHNKQDLLAAGPKITGRRPFDWAPAHSLAISAATGHGVEELLRAIEATLDASREPDHLPTFYCERQWEAASRALGHAEGPVDRVAYVLQTELLGT